MFIVSSTLMWAVLTGPLSNRLGLSHWNPYTVRRGSCLYGKCLYAQRRRGCIVTYCNVIEWFWCDSSLISTINCFPSMLCHCWFGHLACKNPPQMTYNVLIGTFSLYTATTAVLLKRFCSTLYLLCKHYLLFCRRTPIITPGRRDPSAASPAATPRSGRFGL